MADGKSWLDTTHPDYAAMQPHWVFCRQSYLGGPAYHEPNLFKFRLEDSEDFQERLQKAARYNFTGQVVDLITGHLLKAGVTTKPEKASEGIRRFWDRCTTDGDTMDNFRREMATWSSVQGRQFVVIDVPSDGGKAPVTELERQTRGLEPYAYMVGPEAVLDLAWDKTKDKSSLRWIKIQESYRDDDDPRTAGDTKIRYRLWEKGKWSLWEKGKDAQGQVTEVLLGEGTIPFAEVPIVMVEHKDGADYQSPGLVDDLVYLDRLVFNAVSELMETLSQQTFSQLTMPSDGFPTDMTLPQFGQYLQMGKRRVFLYDGQASHPPAYISPDASQGTLILETIEKLIEQIYKSVNLGSEVGRHSSEGGSSATSGVTKAYDFAKLESMLADKAAEQEESEKAILRIVDLWTGGAGELDSDIVAYPRKFDIATLAQALQEALSIESVLGGSSPTAVAEMRKQIVAKALDSIEDDVMAVIVEEIDQWAAVEKSEPHEEEELEHDTEINANAVKAGNSGSWTS